MVVAEMFYFRCLDWYSFSMSKKTVTGQIYEKVFELLEESPDGVRWTDLLKRIGESNPEFHPKTVNGCVWRLVEKYPDRVYKPSRGVFRLKKYEERG